MSIAVLRQRATRALRHIQQWRHPELPPIPPYAAALFRLAHIAVGDADTAAIIAADVIALEPADERAALRLLIQRLPDGWLSWPGAAGPGEWLRLRLRREQADRVLSVLGEWDPDARIGLGLWLLWDVRRDEVDAWLGTHDMPDHIAEFVGYLGEGLDLVPLPGKRPACAEIVPELIDADDKTVGRLVRLHTLGCEPCRRRGDGLRATAQMLRRALDAFFRAPLPADFARTVAIRQQQLRQPSVALWKPIVAMALLVLLYIGVLHRPAATAAPLPAPQNAAALLDHALDRFGPGAPGDGTLHERIRFVADGEPWLVERWYDYAGSHRLRLTVRKSDVGPPLLDLVMDGGQTLAYELNAPGAPSQHVVVQNPVVRELAPLLRQLPVAGGVGDSIVPQQNLDLTLLAEAQRGSPALLGTTSWNGRAAYMVVSTNTRRERLQLTIDRETFGLLDARVAPKLAARTTAQRVWQTEQIELLGRRDVPQDTFRLPLRGTVVPIADPRQLEIRPLGILPPAVVAAQALPVPEQLPEPTLLAYLRTSRVGSSIVQLYEGQWSTVLLTAPERVDTATARPLDQAFAHGRFAEIAQDRPQTTTVEFALDAQPDQRMRLYLWHARATDAERQTMTRATLDSIVLLGPENLARFAERFAIVPGQAAPTTTGTPASSDSAFGPAERRFYRLKAAQALQRLDPPSEPSDVP